MFQGVCVCACVTYGGSAGVDCFGIFIHLVRGKIIQIPSLQALTHSTKKGILSTCRCRPCTIPAPYFKHTPCIILENPPSPLLLQRHFYHETYCQGEGGRGGAETALSFATGIIVHDAQTFPLCAPLTSSLTVYQPHTGSPPPGLSKCEGSLILQVEHLTGTRH